MGIFEELQRTLNVIKPVLPSPLQGLPYVKPTVDVIRQLHQEVNPLARTGPRAKLKYPNVRPGARPSSSSSGFGAAPMATGQDSLGLLYEQLLEMLQQPVGVDEGALMSQVRGQLDPIYDERINTANRTADRGSADIEGMYRALSKDYERLAPQQAEQAQQAQSDIEDLYGQLRSSIEGNYSRIAEEQSDLFSQLGIEEAAPSVLNPQAESAAKATTVAEQLGTANQQRYMDIGNIDETYYREGSPLASLTGANRVSDLRFDEQNYVNQTEAERTSGIQQAFTQLQQQAMNRAAQQQGQQQQMLWQILMGQIEAQQQEPGELTADSFLSGLSPSIQGEVSSAFRSLEKSPEAVSGRQELEGHPVPGTYVNLTDEWWYNQVDQMFEQGQISDATRQALIFYLRLRNQ